MPKCKKCRGPTKGYKCDACGALAKVHAESHECGGKQGWPMSDGFGMGGMMNMMGMMNGNFVHDQDDIDWMREEMKEHMNFTDEEFDEMAEHCPMMRRR